MAHGMLLVAALIAGGQEGAAKEPTYQAQTHKAEDSVVARNEKNRTVLVITSQSGIGGADIVLASGAWPEKVTFRFLNSEGKAFRPTKS